MRKQRFLHPSWHALSFSLAVFPPIAKKRKHVEKLHCSLFVVAHLGCPASQQGDWWCRSCIADLVSWMTRPSASAWHGLCNVATITCVSVTTLGDRAVSLEIRGTGMVIRAQICLSFLHCDSRWIGHITGKEQKIMHVYQNLNKWTRKKRNYIYIFIYIN